MALQQFRQEPDEILHPRAMLARRIVSHPRQIRQHADCGGLRQILVGLEQQDVGLELIVLRLQRFARLSRLKLDPHPRLEHVRFDRLGDEIGRAQFESMLFARRIGERSQQTTGIRE